MRTLAVSAMAALLIGGCAPLPEHIPESYVNEAYYQTLTCQELQLGRGNVEREQRLKIGKQLEYVGVLVPPRHSEQNARKIAELKGTSAAIERAQMAKNCLAPSSNAMESPDGEVHPSLLHSGDVD